MAKYYVKHECGHEVQVDLFGKTADRENKIAWLETTLCPECYAREQAQLQNKDNQIEEVEMHYAEYKNNFSNCQTLPNSYDSKTKTIVVLVPVAAEEVAEATEEEILTIEGIAKETGVPERIITIMSTDPRLDEIQLKKVQAQFDSLENLSQEQKEKLAQMKKTVELVKKYKSQQK